MKAAGAPSTVTIPFLPGNTFGDPRKQNFHRQQTLKMKNGIPVAVYEPLAIGGDEHLATTMKKEQQQDAMAAEAATMEELDFTLTYGRRATSATAATTAAGGAMTLENRVLSFQGYFQEAENVVTGEQRTRYVHVSYFLEDDTVTVYEPHKMNSGLPQGALVKRQKIPNLNDAETMLRLGEQVNVFGFNITLTDCDLFTREFYKTLGNPQPTEPIEMPQDNHAKKRKELESPTRRTGGPGAGVGAEAKYQLKKFIENDGKVLKFRCVWDTSKEMYGERQYFVMLYYLVDDTVEVRTAANSTGVNAGKPTSEIGTCLFLKRQRIPKVEEEQEEETTEEEKQPRQVKFVSEAELGIGVKVNVLGREFVIVDADKWTREYYATKYGITEWPTVEIQEEDQEEPKQQVKQPKPKSQTRRNALENQGKVMRFRGVVGGQNKKEYEGRMFVVTMWLADEAISVAELFPSPAKGGQRFLSKARYHKPDDEEEEEYYSATDMFVGQRLVLGGWVFLLTDSDEPTLAYMESHPDMFMYSNLDIVLKKCGDAVNIHTNKADNKATTPMKQKVLGLFGLEQPSEMSIQQWRDGMGTALLNQVLVEHEFLTIIRRFELPPAGSGKILLL